MRKKTKLSSCSSNEDLVEEREELMVSLSENRVSLPHVQTSNTKSKKKEEKSIKISLSSSSPAAVEELVEEREDFMDLNLARKSCWFGLGFQKTKTAPRIVPASESASEIGSMNGLR
ncbi:hypothetical protein F2Q69_00024595 [Brassica cretica]|uniref:Uncharacterized protein n=1 Tax=Brassica cretica TaxID=69181 RepID=A0A8S9Q313_BRACR|nr:hypothetical protein F2Q69_00024595 [Brassica cretica]